MEQKNHQNQNSTLTDNQIGKTGIGRHKFEFLNSKPKETLTAIEIEQMKEYSERFKRSQESSEKIAQYFEMIRKPKIEVEITINAKDLFYHFKSHFLKLNGKEFEVNIETLENISPLIYYFSKDKRFFECENLSNLSEPSFDKGLLIIGGFGNGKSSVMNAFESVFKNVKGHCFKGYTANQVVTMFEKCKEDSDRDEFENIMYFGKRYFDDLKTERIASNFGKVNIFKEILEERYSRKTITHLSTNYQDGYPDDLERALFEFADKYGGRVYDRLFEMYNIIEFKGKSFRK